ncbi:hypothetical protein ACET3Z_004341 [Daucus carota]
MLTSLLFSGSMEVFLDTIQFIGFGFDFFWLVFVLLLLESVLIGFEPVTLDVQNNVDGDVFSGPGCYRLLLAWPRRWDLSMLIKMGRLSILIHSLGIKSCKVSSSKHKGGHKAVVDTIQMLQPRQLVRAEEIL